MKKKETKSKGYSVSINVILLALRLRDKGLKWWSTKPVSTIFFALVFIYSCFWFVFLGVFFSFFFFQIPTFILTNQSHSWCKVWSFVVHSCSKRFSDGRSRIDDFFLSWFFVWKLFFLVLFVVFCFFLCSHGHLHSHYQSHSASKKGGLNAVYLFLKMFFVRRCWADSFFLSWFLIWTGTFFLFLFFPLFFAHCFRALFVLPDGSSFSVAGRLLLFFYTVKEKGRRMRLRSDSGQERSETGDRKGKTMKKSFSIIVIMHAVLPPELNVDFHEDM